MEESNALVEEATARLQRVDPVILQLHKSKQIGHSILHSQEDLIDQFKEEGVLKGEDIDMVTSLRCLYNT